ncbi:MAG TPA: zinc-binding dehydrogenase [Streptosporangiaceae bacterium]|nr:zinc-binding dehydrogenase [Streptosporangiaceae bacterium]
MTHRARWWWCEVRRTDPRQPPAALVEFCQAGKIATLIDRRYRLNEVPEALRYLGEGHAKIRSSSSSSSLCRPLPAPMAPSA